MRPCPPLLYRFAVTPAFVMFAAQPLFAQPAAAAVGPSMMRKRGTAKLDYATAMKTFVEIYCAEQRCAPRTFAWRVFWRCLHRCALPIAPLALVLFPHHFAPDWELLRAAARCASLRQLDEEIRDFVADSANRSWWRRVARVRLSTQRVRRLARRYLPAPTRPPVVAGGATN